MITISPSSARRKAVSVRNEMDRTVEEAENYREEDEPNKSNIVTKSGM